MFYTHDEEMKTFTKKEVAAILRKKKKQYAWVRVNGGEKQIMGPGGQLLGSDPEKMELCIMEKAAEELGFPWYEMRSYFEGSLMRANLPTLWAFYKQKYKQACEKAHK